MIETEVTFEGRYGGCSSNPPKTLRCSLHEYSEDTISVAASGIEVEHNSGPTFLLVTGVDEEEINELEPTNLSFISSSGLWKEYEVIDYAFEAAGEVKFTARRIRLNSRPRTATGGPLLRRGLVLQSPPVSGVKSGPASGG